MCASNDLNLIPSILPVLYHPGGDNSVCSPYWSIVVNLVVGIHSCMTLIVNLGVFDGFIWIYIIFS